jgi:NAD(P)-dependent dehydrogenase (short-subunit alcohol dehydrogenase family)
MPDQDQLNRRIVITGANSGLGLAATKQLASRGATVVMAVRNRGRGEQAAADVCNEIADAHVEIADLDLADQASIHRFADGQAGRGAVAGLINNAGLAMTHGRQFTQDRYELQVGTNFLGHFVLTARMLPALRAAGDARVVSVTSGAAWFAGPFDFDLCERGRYLTLRAYAQSKLAVAIFGFELDRRLKAAGDHIASVVCHPGWSGTSLFDHLNQNMVHRTAEQMASSPQEGARSEVYATTAPQLTGGEFIGPRWIGRGRPRKAVPNPQMTNRAVGRRLWRTAEARTGVEFVV